MKTVILHWVPRWQQKAHVIGPNLPAPVSGFALHARSKQHLGPLVAEFPVCQLTRKTEFGIVGKFPQGLSYEFFHCGTPTYQASENNDTNQR